MADTDRSLKLGVDVDEASINKARKRLEDIEKAQKEVHAEFLKGSKGADAYGKELAELDKEARLLNKSLDALEEPRTIKVDAQQLNRDAQLDFADKSGDKASIAGMSRGALDALTSGNAGAFGQALEGAEAVFDLGEAAGKLGGPIGSVVTALGPAGLAGVAGVAGVALVALNFLLAEAQKRFQEAKDAEKARIDAMREFNEFVAEGGTTEEAQGAIDALYRRQAAAIETQTELEAQRAGIVEELNRGNEVSLASERAAFAALQANTEARDENNKTLEETNASIAEYEAGIKDGTLATNDATAAEKALADERSSAVLEDAAQAGELATLKARANDLTREQIDSELEALDIRKQGLEAELAALEASGDTSEDVAKKIAQLREQLGFLGDQANVLKSAQTTAKSSEAQKAAEKAEQERTKAVEEGSRKQEQAAQEAARAQDAYTKTVRDAKQGFKDAIADIGIRFKDTLVDNNEKLGDSLSEQAIKFNEGELAEEVTFRRDLAKISRDAKRSELDASRQRDFAALRDVREDRDAALAERRDDEEAANRQQLVEFKQQQDALGRERERADREALQDAERARRDAASARDRQIRDAKSALEMQAQMEIGFQQQSLRGWDNYFKQVISRQEQATGSRQTSTTSRTSSTSSRQSSTNLNELQLILNSR